MANNLQLGDVIRIVAPENEKLNEATCYINYYDPNDMMELIHVSSMISSNIIRLKGGKIMDPTIEKIILLNRSLHKGFARQNGLLPNTWIDIEFTGDVRSVIIAQITHLEEDMIELTTFPQRDVLYIDFAYKGIPKNIPIKHLCFCKKPASYESIEPESKESEEPDEDIEDVKTEYNEDGNLVMEIPQNVRLEEDYRKKLHEEYTKNSQEVSVSSEAYYQGESESFQYSIDAQMNFLLDDFLSAIPDGKRTNETMRRIYIHLNRFKELRDMYSTKDEYDQVTGFRMRDPTNYKPLVEQLYNMKKSHFIIPVANVQNHLYRDSTQNQQAEEEFTENPTLEPLYNEDYILENDVDKILDEIETEKELFWENTASSQDNKYEELYLTLNNDFYRPHSVFVETAIEPIAKNIFITEDTDYFLGRNNTNYSSVITRFTTTSKLFNIKRFNAPIYYSHFLKKSASDFRILMDGDKINIQSLIMLPEESVTTARCLYGSILDKTKYSAPLLSTMTKNTPIKKHDVDLQKDSTVLPLETSFVDINLSSIDTAFHSVSLEHPLYNTFLQAVIPNIFTLINHYYAKNANKYNINQYLKSLSPYGYTHEELSFRSLQSISKHIYGNIQNYVKDRLQNRDELINYALFKYTINEKETKLLDAPFDVKYLPLKETVLFALRKKFRMLYSIKEDEEDFAKVITEGDGLYFFAWMIYLNMSLISPLNMIEPFVESKHFYDVNQKVIGKKYASLREMQEDNDKRDLKFDESYDANQYDVLQKYRREMSEMPPEKFLQFLNERLSEEYGCSLDNTKELAEELVQGFKLVKEGDYALLEMKPHLPPGVEECSFTEKEKEEIAIEANTRKIQKYFKRVNHVWVYDPDVSSDSFAKPKDLTCALEKSDAIGKLNRERIFKSQYGENMEIIGKNIKKQVDRLENRLILHFKMEKEKKSEKDKYFTKLGNQAYTSEVIQSPNKLHLDEILHKSNSFEDKQMGITMFYIVYCRDPLPHENPNWKYCNESEHSVPLLPTALLRLAESFNKGKYNETLLTLVKETLIKYEDGRYVITNGGYILDDIEFSDVGMELLEEADERDTWEAVNDIDSHYFVDMSSGKRTYTNTKLRMAYNIANAICKNMFLPIDKVEATLMRLCTDFLSRKDLIMTEEKYTEQMKNKKGKIPSYETYEKLKILYLTICCLVVAVQSLIPSFEPRRTFGKCVKILDGYPLSEDSGQEGTLIYMACIIRKMHEDRKTLPWSAVPIISGEIEKQLHKMFAYILTYDEVNRLLKEKREYLETADDNIPNEVNSLVLWKRFLPPLVPTKILDGKVPLRNVEKNVNEALKRTLKTGSPDQWKYLGVYFCKIFSFSFGLSEIVHQIIKEKGGLLGKYGKRFWLENACCNEVDSPQNPIEYFGSEENDPRILDYIKSVQGLGKLIHQTKLYLRSPFLHVEKMDPENKERTKVIPFCTYSEEMMYRTFISYCNLDSPIKPIPVYLEAFISEKPEEYNAKGSIEEKIEFLKEKGKVINLSTFQSMMMQVYRNNELHVTTPVQISYHDKVMDELSKMKEQIQDSKLEGFSAHFEAYVNRESVGNVEDDTETPVAPEKISDDLLDNLENYLQLNIDEMQRYIRDFMETLGNRKDVIDRLMKNFTSWNENLSHISMGHFIKNYLYYLCNVIPTFIISNHSISKITTKTNLMKEDKMKMDEMLSKKYSYLNKFVKDKILSPFLEKASEDLRQMYKFISNFYGFFPSSRQTLYGRYFLFSLNFIFYYFIVLTEKQDVLQIIVKNTYQDEDDNTNEDDPELDDTMEEMDINLAEKGEIQEKVLEFIKVLLATKEVYHRDKVSILTTYEEIRNNVERLEDEEKIRMMERFREIKEHRTRRAEKELKKYHIGEYFIDPKVIKKYGRRRDEMLNTEDITEDDFLFMDETSNEEMEILKSIEELRENNSDNEDDEDEMFSNEEEMEFLGNYAEDDAYDIAENALDRLE